MSDQGLLPFELGYPRTELRRKLVEAVLRGEKIATAGLAADFQPIGEEPLPKPGDRWSLMGYEDEPVGVVETRSIRVVAAKDVDLQFARDEGEGFWSDQNITDETLIVCEYFALIEKF